MCLPQVNVDQAMASLIQYLDQPEKSFNHDNLMLKVVRQTSLDQIGRFESHGAVIQVGPKANTTSTSQVGVSFNAFPNLQCIANGLPDW